MDTPGIDWTRMEAKDALSLHGVLLLVVVVFIMMLNHHNAPHRGRRLQMQAQVFRKNSSLDGGLTHLRQHGVRTNHSKFLEWVIVNSISIGIGIVRVSVHHWCGGKTENHSDGWDTVIVLWDVRIVQQDEQIVSSPALDQASLESTTPVRCTVWRRRHDSLQDSHEIVAAAAFQKLSNPQSSHDGAVGWDERTVARHRLFAGPGQQPSRQGKAAGIVIVRIVFDTPTGIVHPCAGTRQ